MENGQNYEQFVYKTAQYQKPQHSDTLHFDILGFNGDPALLGCNDELPLASHDHYNRWSGTSIII